MPSPLSAPAADKANTPGRRDKTAIATIYRYRRGDSGSRSDSGKPRAE